MVRTFLSAMQRIPSSRRAVGRAQRNVSSGKTVSRWRSICLTYVVDGRWYLARSLPTPPSAAFVSRLPRIYSLGHRRMISSGNLFTHATSSMDLTIPTSNLISGCWTLLIQQCKMIFIKKDGKYFGEFRIQTSAKKRRIGYGD